MRRVDVIPALQSFAPLLAASIVGVIAGIFGGPLVEQWFAPPDARPDRLLLVALGAIVVMLVITSIMALKAIRQAPRLHDRFEELSRQLGLKVRFVHDPPSGSNGEAYRAARSIINQAEHSLVFLQHSRRRTPQERAARPSVESKRYTEEREKYHAAVVKKVQQHANVRNFYRRVIQFEEGTIAKVHPDRVSSHWISHFAEVMKVFAADTKTATGYIKKVALHYPQTFAIVDERFVIWTLHGIDPSAGVQIVEGVLLFDDPDKHLVAYLLDIYNKVDKAATIVRQVPEH
ncbi:MAG TPA: hypothetical protein VFQ45_11245 [Longimicrobium sp.]|nr:hypothetical protein [Longimicrobium sp.]